MFFFNNPIVFVSLTINLIEFNKSKDPNVLPIKGHLISSNLIGVFVFVFILSYLKQLHQVNNLNILLY